MNRFIDNPPPDLIVSLACNTASNGPCAKSKRGVVIYGPDSYQGNVPVIFGNAFNSQPWPYECDKSDACKAACGQLCIHAEQRAIMQMIRPSPTDLALFKFGDEVRYPEPGSLALVHVKVVDGKLVPSPKGPSCEQCSKLIVENKWIGRVWLYVAEGSWNGYDPVNFHRKTLIACGLPITL